MITKSCDEKVCGPLVLHLLLAGAGPKTAVGVCVDHATEAVALLRAEADHPWGDSCHGATCWAERTDKP